MTSPDAPSPPKPEVQNRGSDRLPSSPETGAVSQSSRDLSSPSGPSASALNDRFGPQASQKELVRTAFGSQHPDGKGKDVFIAMAGDDSKTAGGKPSAEFEHTGSGKTSDGRDYLTFKPPSTMDVKDIKYFPDTGTYEMTPDKAAPPKAKDPSAYKTYPTEDSLPITKVSMNPDTGRMDFELANKSSVSKGWGKKLNFGEKQDDGSIKFGGTVQQNDGKTFTVGDIKGLTGSQIGFEKEIPTFTMAQNAKGKHECVASTRGLKSKDAPAQESPESMSKTEFGELTGNARMYMDTLKRISAHINEHDLLASLK